MILRYDGAPVWPSLVTGLPDAALTASATGSAGYVPMPLGWC